jgi:hypothetical protein
MISFDYASQIKIPVNSWETQGDWISNTFGVSVHLFGISVEDEQRHHHMLYTEGFSHGSTNVVSLLNKFFIDNPRVATAKQLIVYTDSCGGQNRNNLVLSYFCTRVCAGLHEEILWNFTIVEHTKFVSDHGFALVRNAQRQANIYTMAHWL